MWTWQDVNEHYLDALAVSYPALTRYITNVGEIHSKAMMSYLTYMAQRIVEMHRVLKNTGSLYLHCDPTASHYLKVLMDEIFGKNNFINEIVWSYQSTANPLKSFKRKHDIMLFYVENEDNYLRVFTGVYIWRFVRVAEIQKPYKLRVFDFSKRQKTIKPIGK